MQFDRSDLIGLFYTMGAVFAGTYLDRTMIGYDIEVVFLVGAAMSIPLTLYFKATVLPKIQMTEGSPDREAR